MGRRHGRLAQIQRPVPPGLEVRPDSLALIRRAFSQTCRSILSLTSHLDAAHCWNGGLVGGDVCNLFPTAAVGKDANAPVPRRAERQRRDGVV
jgi:hypothetical protein